MIRSDLFNKLVYKFSEDERIAFLIHMIESFVAESEQEIFIDRVKNLFDKNIK